MDFQRLSVSWSVNYHIIAVISLGYHREINTGDSPITHCDRYGLGTIIHFNGFQVSSMAARNQNDSLSGR